MRADETIPDSTGTAVWLGGALNLVSPSGSFDPPGETPQFGFGAHLSIQPVHSKFGVRLEFGMASGDATTDSVAVEFMPGFTAYETVKAGNDLMWFLLGAQWDPRPRGTSLYAFTSFGIEKITPKGVAGEGSIVHIEVPGLPGSSSVFAYSAGAGGRIVSERVGLCLEAEYLKGDAADYVGSPGVEGNNPTHYAVRNAPIGFFAIRVGIVRRY